MHGVGQTLLAGSGFAQDHGWQFTGCSLLCLLKNWAKHWSASQIGCEQIKDRVRVNGVGRHLNRDADPFAQAQNLAGRDRGLADPRAI